MKVYELTREEFDDYIKTHHKDLFDEVLYADNPSEYYKVLCRLKEVMEEDVYGRTN